MWDRIVSGFNSLFGGQQKLISPVPDEEQRPSATPTLTRAPRPKQITPDQIEAGLRKFDASSPLLDYTDDLAEAANKMPKNADRWLPIVMAIMETGGGKKLAAENNPYNLRGSQGGRTKFIDYPDMRVAMLGGDNGGTPAKGFVGTINEHPAYEGYRQSGNLEDFFKSFTPPGAEYGNPTMDELKSRYGQIKSLFEETQQAAGNVSMSGERKKRMDELARRARQY